MKKLIPLIIIIITSIPIYAVNGNLGNGDGSETNPYLIEDFSDFQEFRTHSSYWAYEVYTKLMCDIDLSPSLSGRQIYTAAVIAPDTDDDIYYYQGIPFSGNFDGNNHIIKNAQITGKDLLGVFGHLGDSIWQGNPGTISNLRLVNIQITGTGDWTGGLVGSNRNGYITNCSISDSIIEGDDNIGGLVGSFSSGQISHCHSSATVNGDNYLGGLVGNGYGTVQFSAFSGEVNGNYDVGGIVGDNEAVVTAGYNSGNVYGKTHVGGIAGNNNLDGDEISQCYNAGGITGRGSIGGIVGYNSNIVSNCYSAGIITAVSIGGHSPYDAGGLVGTNTTRESYYGIISNCYSTSEIQCEDESAYDIGGLIGSNTGVVIYSFWDIKTSTVSASAAGFPKTSEQLKQAETFIGWGDNLIWMINEGNDYPRLNWEDYPGYEPLTTSYPDRTYAGNGTETDPFIMINADDMICMTSRPSDWEKYFELTNDIDMAGVSDYMPVACFTGHFNGNNHIIQNLTIDSTVIGCYDNLGLFGWLDTDGVIMNLGVDNINIQTTGSRVGGLVGMNYEGNILNCFSNGTITSTENETYCIGGLVGKSEDGNIENCRSNATVSGHTSVGGMVGYNSGPISCSYSQGNVTGRGDAIGGLVGNNHDDIIYCHSTCSVQGIEEVGGLVGSNSSAEIAQSYSTGPVSGNNYVGGFCASNYSKLITNCYSTSPVTAQSDVAGFCQYNSGTITNCFVAAPVTGNSSAGFCQNSYEDSIINCFWDVNMSGIGQEDDNNFGAIGKTTEQMLNPYTFLNAGWKFVGKNIDPEDNVWIMRGYPALQNQSEIAFEGLNVLSLPIGSKRQISLDIYSAYNRSHSWTAVSADPNDSCIAELSPTADTSYGPWDKRTLLIEVNASGLPVGTSTRNAKLSVDNGETVDIPIRLHTYEPIGMEELAQLSACWAMEVYEDPNLHCTAVDWYTDNQIDIQDLLMLTESWLDETIIPYHTFDDFETGDFNYLNWTFSGDSDWQILSGSSAYSGEYYAKSGYLSLYYSSCYLILEDVDTGNNNRISFAKKLFGTSSSRSLSFYIDGNLAATWNCQDEWEIVSFEIPSGNYHTFKWKYYRVSSNPSNFGGIDNIRFYYEP